MKARGTRRILFVSGPFARGEPAAGAELQTYLIASELAKKSGFNISLVALDSDRNGREQQGNVELNFIARGIKKYLIFWKILKRIDTDVCYTRNFSKLLICIILCRMVGSKIVVNICSANDCRFLKTRRDFGERSFSRSLISLVGSIIYKCRHDASVYALRFSDEIIVQNEQQNQMLQSNFGLRAKKIIYNARHIPPITEEMRPRSKVIWVGKDFKNPKLFVDLASRLKYTNADFVMIGIQNNPLWTGLGRDQNLKILGVVSRQQVLEELRTSLVFVSTSFGEGFPNTFIEAWMNEVPVVSLHVDPDSIIKNNGLGFHSGSFEKLVENVKYLIENPQEARKMGKRARQYVEEYHDIEKSILEYEKIFRSLTI